MKRILYTLMLAAPCVRGIEAPQQNPYFSKEEWKRIECTLDPDELAYLKELIFENDYKKVYQDLVEQDFLVEDYFDHVYKHGFAEKIDTLKKQFGWDDKDCIAFKQDLVDYRLYLEGKITKNPFANVKEFVAHNTHFQTTLAYCEQEMIIKRQMISLNWARRTEDHFRKLFKAGINWGESKMLGNYTAALVTLKLKEAEDAWFKTTAADEKYGNAYYDRAWQKELESKEKDNQQQ